MKKFVAYYRVSTKKQGVSGLGLDAQKSTVNNFVGANVLLAEYTETESGKNDTRLELLKAIAYAKENNATLAIAKLDRLSRNVAFIFELKDSKVDFVCCDMPDANTMTIGIFAVLAQHERELISDRTKKALRALKNKGVKLGSPGNLTDNARRKSIVIRKELALINAENKKAFALINILREQNKSFRYIAEQLNNAGFKTSKGNKFFAMSVKQLYDRVKSANVANVA